MNPSAIPELAAAVAGANDPRAAFVVGIVVQHSPEGLLVAPGGLDAEPVLAGWPRGVYQPCLGDAVALLNQGAAWYCVGPIGGPMDVQNAVANYSFEASASGVFPARWTLVTTSGTPALTTVEWRHPEFVDGSKVARLNATTSASTNCAVVSDPIPVTPGERWGLGAWYRPAIGSIGNAGTIRIYASWYTDSTLNNLVSQESTVNFPLIRAFGWRLMTENGVGGRGAAAPTGANYLRVRIVANWFANSGDSLYLDRVTARRIS